MCSRAYMHPLSPQPSRCWTCLLGWCTASPARVGGRSRGTYLKSVPSPCTPRQTLCPIARLAIAYKAEAMACEGAYHEDSVDRGARGLDQTLRNNNRDGLKHWKKHVQQDGWQTRDCNFPGRRHKMPLTVAAMEEFEGSTTGLDMASGTLPTSLLGMSHRGYLARRQYYACGWRGMQKATSCNNTLHKHTCRAARSHVPRRQGTTPGGCTSKPPWQLGKGVCELGAPCAAASVPQRRRRDCGAAGSCPVRWMMSLLCNCIHASLSPVSLLLHKWPKVCICISAYIMFFYWQMLAVLSTTVVVVSQVTMCVCCWLPRRSSKWTANAPHDAWCRALTSSSWLWTRHMILAIWRHGSRKIYARMCTVVFAILFFLLADNHKPLLRSCYDTLHTGHAARPNNASCCLAHPTWHPCKKSRSCCRWHKGDGALELTTLLYNVVRVFLCDCCSSLLVLQRHWYQYAHQDIEYTPLRQHDNVPMLHCLLYGVWKDLLEYSLSSCSSPPLLLSSNAQYDLLGWYRYLFVREEYINMLLCHRAKSRMPRSTRGITTDACTPHCAWTWPPPPPRVAQPRAHAPPPPPTLRVTPP